MPSSSQETWNRLRYLIKECLTFAEIKDAAGQAGLPLHQLAHLQQRRLPAHGASKSELLDEIGVLLDQLQESDRRQAVTLFIQVCLIKHPDRRTEISREVLRGGFDLTATDELEATEIPRTRVAEGTTIRQVSSSVRGALFDNNTIRSIKTFISYKWQDDAHNKWVEKLATDLRRAGINAILDRWEVRFGDSFTDYMTSKIAEADVVLFVMTTKSVEAAESPKGQGGAVKFEMQMAAARRIAGEKMRLIPIYREGQKTAAHVRDHRYADFRDDFQYEQRLLELIEDLRGDLQIPPVSHPGRLVGHTSIGQELGDNKLQGEFIPRTHDLIVWVESSDGPKSQVARYLAQDAGYLMELMKSVPFATRVKVTLNGDIVIVQERDGVLVLDARTMSVKARLPFSRVDDRPFIRSETLQPDLPIVIVGTDYGKLVAWNWESDEIVFNKHYFTPGKVEWINSLAIDSQQRCVLFVVNNVLFRIQLSDGQILQKEELGAPEETSGLAFCNVNRLLAVGGLMETRVYHLGVPCRHAYTILNGRPLAQEIRFSDDGQLLAILSGMGVGGNAATVRDARTGAVLRGFSDVYPGSSSTKANDLFSLSVRSISFSDDGKLLAIGEGGRIGIYARA